MSARINYNRITGSNIQGDATTVTEPLGTLVVTNNGELRLHDGTTAGGNSVGGGGSGNGWQITSGSYSVSVADSGVVTMATSRGNIEFGALPEPGGTSHFHIMKSSSSTDVDLYFGDDYNYVLQRGNSMSELAGHTNDYGVEIGTQDLNTGTSEKYVWRFGTDGKLTVPGDIKSTAGTGPVVINSNDGATTHTWTFGTDGTTTLASGVEISNTDDFNFLSWNTGTALIIADVPYTAGSYIYIPSSSDTNGSLGIVNTNTAGSIMLTQGSGNDNTNNQLYVNNSGTTINNILAGISKTWAFGTDGALAFPNLSTFDGQTLIDHSSSTNYTLKIANGGVAGSKFGIGTGDATFGIANDALNHEENGYVPYTVTAQNINLTVPGTGTWAFGTDGSLTLPSGAGFGLGNSGQLKVNDTTTQSLDFRDASGRGFYTNDDGYALRSNGNNTWQFGTTGSITFPQGGTLRVSGVPTHSTGATGDKAGTVAFANDYIYYCTADYALTQYPALAALSGANGVDNGYLVPNSYQLPSVGWIIYYNNQTAVINQVNNGGYQGYYIVFTDTPLFIPADSIFLYGPPSADIWKRTAHGTGTW